MNKLVRLQNPGPNVPAPGTRQGDWIWDGNQWSCNPCCPDDSVPPFPCPPPGWPPAGCPPWFSGANSPPWYPGANAGVSFGTVPPANPVRGHFWWDGITLWMFDGAAWVAAGGGSAGQGAASVAIGTNPPAAPQPGALWFDGAMLLLWTGTAWIPTEGNATGTSPPANPSNGMLWWNGSTLMVWDGTAWVPVSQTKSYIQATAPPSPNPGDTWWDGTQMRIWTGSAWALVGPGSFVGPIGTTTNTFGITAPSNLSIATSVWSIVPWTATPIVNTQGSPAWDPIAMKLTPKVAGNYLFQARGYGSGPSTGIALLKNDPGSFTNGVTEAVLAIASNSAAGWMQIDALTVMNGSTDFVRLYFDPGSTTGTFYGQGANPLFTAWLLP